MWAIAKKEFKQYFLSPIGYIYIGIFLLSCSLYFLLFIFSYQSIQFSTMFSPNAILAPSVILIFIVPILTMRMFAEERKNGTEVLLLTSPRSVTQIVLGKFIAASMVVLVSTFATFIYFFILQYFGAPQLASSIVSILGFSLLAIAYVAFGMFASSLTENQVISAIIAIGFILLSTFLPNVLTFLGDYSLLYAFCDSFLNGTIGISNLVLLVSFTAMFIIFTIMVIQRRKNVK